MKQSMQLKENAGMLSGALCTLTVYIRENYADLCPQKYIDPQARFMFPHLAPYSYYYIYIYRTLTFIGCSEVFRAHSTSTVIKI